MYPGDGILLQEDFKQPSVSWSAARHDPDLRFLYYEPRTRSALSAQFTNSVHRSGLFQLNVHLNQSLSTSGRVLDLVFANSAIASV